MHWVFGAHEKHSTESIAGLFFLTAFPYHSVEIRQKKIKNFCTDYKPAIKQQVSVILEKIQSPKTEKS